MNDTELAERVAVALEAKAAEVTRPRRGFHPADGNVVPFDEPKVGTPGRSGGRNRWRALAAAAAVLALVITGGVIVMASDDGPGGTTETDVAGPQQEEDGAVGDSVSSGPPDALAPGWVPDDLLLWEAWSTYGPVPGDQGDAQLFMGPSEEAGVLVEIDEAPGPHGGMDQIEVRGQEGWSDTGGGADALFWDERDAAVAVFYKGMSTEDTIAFLESLSWRSEDPQDGFEPPEASTLSLVGETAGSSDDGEALNTRYVYGYGEPTVSLDHDMKLTIMTTVPLGDAAGSLTRDYLNTWFGGGRDEDGTVTELHFNPELTTLEVIGPDGSQVRIGARYEGLDESNVLRIADSISAVSGGELDGLRRSVSDLYADMPVLASADLPSATLSVRGREADQDPDDLGVFRAFCIEVGETDTWCSAEAPVVGSGTDRRLTSLRVGEDWYVAAVSPEEPPLITKGAVSAEALNEAMADNPDLDPEEIARALEESQGGTPEELAIDSETAVDDEWRFALAVAPADIDDVTVWFGTGYGTLFRSESL